MSSNSQETILENLTTKVLPRVREKALTVDEQHEFPQQSLEALKENGFLGLISATSVGGTGAGLATAVEVIEALAAECGSTAMILAMHYSATAAIEKFSDNKTRVVVANGKNLIQNNH